MRQYQEKIYSAVIKKGDWFGSNTCVMTRNGITDVIYYATKIAVVDHNKHTATFNNGGYTNASTTSRINAVKEACIKLSYIF